MGGTFDGSEVLKMQANLSEENVIFIGGKTAFAVGNLGGQQICDCIWTRLNQSQRILKSVACHFQNTWRHLQV